MQNSSSLVTQLADAREKAPNIAMTAVDPVAASPWILFGGIFVVASLGGIAALLRSGQDITGRLVLSAFLNSGLVGLIVGLLMWSSYSGKDPYLIFGVSALAGLGGAATLEVLFQLAKKKLGLGPGETQKPDNEKSN
jgi:hypothetical protein